MILKKINVSNFRSILSEEIVLDSKCIGLIGLNESGKSNILKAIQIAGHNYSYSNKDKSKICNDFPKVEFEFKISSEDQLKSVVDSFTTENIITGWDDFQLILDGLDSVTYKVIYNQVEKEVERDFGYFFEYDIKLNKKILQKDDTVEATPNLNIPISDENVALSKINYVEAKLISEEYLKYFKEVELEDLKELLDDAICEYFDANFPQIIFWEYSDKFLLPSEITYDDLMSGGDPSNNSAPLFNILKLKNSIGVKNKEELENKIELWKSDSSERRKDGRILTETLNTYIKGIWLDYNQQLYIEFEETKITIHINDPISNQSNFYEMESRSQGFKTFISFILTIAAEADDGNISNFLLLLDEPETHLHPSGVRYMRDELLKLSNMGNYIIYATHSIFMIDRKNLTRHLIVSKQEELTTLTKVDRNNFIQETVIYEAMGTQLDEFSIGVKNIIFEGEIDRKLWEFFVERCLEKKNRGNASEFVSWDGGGTKRITKFFTDKILPKDSMWHLVLDNDSAGQNLKSTLEEKYLKVTDINCNCIFYSEEKNFELEDILPSDLILNSINNASDKLAQTLTVPFELSSNRPIGSVVEEFKEKNKFTKDQKILFEKYYKEALDYHVSTILTNIDKEANTFALRLDLFSKSFEKYYSFCEKFLVHFIKDTK